MGDNEDLFPAGVHQNPFAAYGYPVPNNHNIHDICARIINNLVLDYNLRDLYRMIVDKTNKS